MGLECFLEPSPLRFKFGRNKRGQNPKSSYNSSYPQTCSEEFQGIARGPLPWWS